MLSPPSANSWCNKIRTPPFAGRVILGRILGAAVAVRGGGYSAIAESNLVGSRSGQEPVDQTVGLIGSLRVIQRRRSCRCRIDGRQRIGQGIDRRGEIAPFPAGGIALHQTIPGRACEHFVSKVDRNS
jgi:hypothetical protein